MMLWLSLARCTKTPLLVAAGRRTALSLRCVTAAPLTGNDDADSGQDAAHWRTRAWEDKILLSLQAYKRINGDTVVPRPFIVPNDGDHWPKVAWGYRLGMAVNNLRNRLQAGEFPAKFLNDLEKLGFVRDFYQYQWSEVIMPALHRYYKMNGNLDVPQRYVVPRGDGTWPKASWGLNLGFTVKDIRNSGTYAEQVAASKKELEKMDFCFMAIYERDWKERVLPALATYRREFGDCIVRKSFVAPSELPWPEKAWGMKLGNIVSDIRFGKSYGMPSTRDRDILDSLGFVWNVRAFVWKEQIVPALKVYSEKRGHCRMAETFVVPSQVPWPKKAWGLKLGEKLGDMRRKGTYFTHFGRDAERLDALNFSLIMRVDAFEKLVVPLIELYKSVTGDQDIPDDFVIPSEAPWPEEMWGVHLGLIVARNAHHLR